MSTDGLKRLVSEWHKNSYFQNKSMLPDSSPNIELLHAAIDVDKTTKETLFSSLISSMVPYLRVIQRSSKLLGFIVLRFLVTCVLAAYYLIDGTWLAVRRSRRPENYECSARVLDILGRHKYDTLVNLNSISDFILLHRGFDHPGRILADEVSLYEVNDEQAVFVETPPGVEVWRGRLNSFHAIAQLENAVRVVVLPIESFYRLADEFGDPKGKLVFIMNTARCGSTLLSQIYEKTDEFLSLSEPTGINCLRRFVGHEDDASVQYHARAIIRVLCKPTHLSNFAIKITPNSTKIVPLLKRLYPNASFVFIYRDVLPVCKSMYKIWKELPMGRLNIILCKFAPWIYLPALNFSRYYDPVLPEERFRVIPGYGQGCLLWANVIGMYRRFRRSGIDIAAVKYEDLVQDKELAVRRLFQYNGISLTLVEPALRAFESDSQANSLISMEVLKKTKLPPFTDDMKTETNKICVHYELPKIGESCVLEGTITRE
ncbi:hypothetical protein LSH36_749g00002 [Paralvinella palmiformis]|uniref:Sulfotransferase domain-containing protein n=1 Tax=Paralvinella palmiformis TaxID=53620 RepID=A0AAD9J1D7_9ANNE|nr:hypothetical protein LSH36_749g00002 [Paralvinella palmiformis]